MQATICDFTATPKILTKSNVRLQGFETQPGLRPYIEDDNGHTVWLSFWGEILGGEPTTVRIDDKDYAARVSTLHNGAAYLRLMHWKVNNYTDNYADIGHDFWYFQSGIETPKGAIVVGFDKYTSAFWGDNAHFILPIFEIPVSIGQPEPVKARFMWQMENGWQWCFVDSKEPMTPPNEAGIYHMPASLYQAKNGQFATPSVSKAKIKDVKPTIETTAKKAWAIAQTLQDEVAGMGIKLVAVINERDSTLMDINAKVKELNALIERAEAQATTIKVQFKDTKALAAWYAKHNASFRQSIIHSYKDLGLTAQDFI